MLYSMTGIGRHYEEAQGLSLNWEIKSVNNKYFDIRWKLPQTLRMHEDIFDKILRSRAHRGRVEISLEVKASSENSNKLLSFDAVQAKAMLEELKTFAKDSSLDFNPDLNRFFPISSLWKNQLESDESLLEFFKSSFEKAVDDWNKSRAAEAKNLALDLFERQKKMLLWVQLIEDKSEQIKQDRIEQIRDRVSHLLRHMGSELEESHFLQEMVLIADKMDISEELTRLHSHLKRLTELINQGQDAGRKLDFTLQECFREINTCGNKVQDIQVSHIVIDLKTELEKCREQVQNLE